MYNRKKLGTVAASLVALTVLAGCGSSDSGSSDEMGFALEEKQASCVGNKMAATIGVDRFAKAEITPAAISSSSTLDFEALALDKSEAEKLCDHFGSCDVDLRESLVGSLAGDESATPEAKKCIEDLFDEATPKSFVVFSMTSGDPEQMDDSVATAVAGMFDCAMAGQG